MIHFFLTITGVDTSTIAGQLWYNWWSAFGAVLERLTELVCIGGVLYWHHQCLYPTCHNWGRVKHQHYCKKHHPEIVNEEEKK